MKARVTVGSIGVDPLQPHLFLTGGSDALGGCARLIRLHLLRPRAALSLQTAPLGHAVWQSLRDVQLLCAVRHTLPASYVGMR